MVQSAAIDAPIRSWNELWLTPRGPAATRSACIRRASAPLPRSNTPARLTLAVARSATSLRTGAPVWQDSVNRAHDGAEAPSPGHGSFRRRLAGRPVNRGDTTDGYTPGSARSWRSSTVAAECPARDPPQPGPSPLRRAPSQLAVLGNSPQVDRHKPATRQRTSQGGSALCTVKHEEFGQD